MSKWSITPKVHNAFEDALAELRSEIEVMRNQLDEESEKFQESNKGEAIGGWIDTWETFIENLEYDKPSAKPE